MADKKHKNTAKDYRQRRNLWLVHLPFTYLQIVLQLVIHVHRIVLQLVVLEIDRVVRFFTRELHEVAILPAARFFSFSPSV